MSRPNDRLPHRTTRRALLPAAGGLALAACGCGGLTSEPVSTSFQGTPVPVPRVPGAEGRWAGRTLRVAAFGGNVEAALRRHVWDPFAVHTGCAVETTAVSFAPVATPVPDDESSSFSQPLAAADLLLADPIAATAAGRRGDLAELPAGVVPDDALGADDDTSSAPAFAYALTNAHRRSAFPDGGAPSSWSEWWDTQRFPGARSLGRSPIGSLEVALLADGVDGANLYPLDLDRAFAALDRIAPYVDDRWWSRGIEPVGWLGSDRAELASAWHHRVVAGQWDGLAVDLVWDEGLLVVDRWVVPAGAREPEMAAELIAFSLAPDRQAAIARETRLGPVVPAALRFIEPWLYPTIPTAPPHDESLVRLDPGWWATAGEEARVEFERWLTTKLR